MIPSVTANLTTITDCDTVTGWTGDTFVLDNELKKQGSNSVSCALTTNGVNSITFTPTAAIDLSGQHFRAWINTTISAFMPLSGLNGIQVSLSDGSNTATWNIGDQSTYAGGWLNIVIYADSTPDIGSVNSSIISSFTFTINTTAKPRNQVNMWVDYLRFGDGLTITGGTSGDPIDLNGVYGVDVANGYGIVERFNTVLFLSGAIQSGNGAVATYHKEVDQLIVFTGANVSPTLYKLDFKGSGCEIEMSGTTIKSAGQRFDILANDVDLLSFSAEGMTISVANNTKLKAGQSFVSSVFNNCNQIHPSLATFTSNTVNATAETTNGAILRSSDNASGNNFTNNLRACEYDQIQTSNDSGNQYSGNTYDIQNSSTGLVTLTAIGGANPTTFINTNGGSTVIDNFIGLTITSNISLVGAEIRIYDLDNTPSGSLGTELSGVESNSTSSYLYSGVSGNSIWVQIMLNGYEEFGQQTTIPITDGGFFAQLNKDINS